MSRIVEFEIAGIKYPLNFSTRATEILLERYGGIDGLAEMFSNKSQIEVLRETLFLLHVLIDQGLAHRRLEAQLGLRDPESLPPALSLDDLGVLISPVDDLNRAKDAVMSAILAGSDRTVEVEPDPKNAETTQAP